MNEHVNHMIKSKKIAGRGHQTLKNTIPSLFTRRSIGKGVRVDVLSKY
jgi:hypothetical protein